MWGQSCLVLMCTMFSLYIIKLKATVTLIFNGLISKSIGFIYTLIQMSVPDLRNPGQLFVYIYPYKVWSISQYVDGHRDLDLCPIDLKINLNHLHLKMQVCAKFEEPRSIPCFVIIQTMFGLYVNMLTVTVTLAFDLKVNRDHLHPEMHVCTKFGKPRSILCLVII